MKGPMSFHYHRALLIARENCGWRQRAILGPSCAVRWETNDVNTNHSNMVVSNSLPTLPRHVNTYVPCLVLWSDGDTHVPLTSTSHFRQGWRLSVFSVHADLSRTMALWWLLRFYATAKTCMDYFIVHTRSVRVKPPSYRLPTIHTIHTPAMHRGRWKKSILLSHKHGVFQWHCKHTASWSQFTHLPPTYMAHCYTGKKTDNAGFFQTCSATFYWLARFYH